MDRYEFRRVLRAGLGAAVVFLSCLISSVSSGARIDLPAPRVVKQGDVIALTFPLKAGEQVDAPIRGRFQGREVPTFPTPDGVGVLLGVDMDDPPGPAEFVLEAPRFTPPHILDRVPIMVESGDFGVQTLSLPKEKVDLDETTLKRVREEQQAVLTAMQPVSPRLWEGNFVISTVGTARGTFGQRRVINGEPRQPHNGEDISAPLGTPVLATNRGIVRIVAEQFFSGNSVIIDHGLGVYSMYFHLATTTVKPGDEVQKSQVIGTVGATGRASGPHLHWGIRLNGARVNPLSLAAVQIP